MNFKRLKTRLSKQRNWNVSYLSEETKVLVYEAKSNSLKSIQWIFLKFIKKKKKKVHVSCTTALGICILYMKVLVTQLCLTLFNPMDHPGSSVHAWNLQARILEWIAISFSRGSSQSRDWTRSPGLQAYSSPSEPPGKAHIFIHT